MELQALSAALLSATGASDIDAAVAEVARLRAAETALTAQVRELSETNRKTRRDALIGAALSDGRIAPAKREAFEKIGDASLDALELSLSALEAPKPSKITPATAPDVTSTTLSAQEQAWKAKYNLSDEALIASRST